MNLTPPESLKLFTTKLADDVYWAVLFERLLKVAFEERRHHVDLVLSELVPGDEVHVALFAVVVVGVVEFVLLHLFERVEGFGAFVVSADKLLACKGLEMRWHLHCRVGWVVDTVVEWCQ